MAGVRTAAIGGTVRSYTPDMSQGWRRIGFRQFSVRNTEGLQDEYVPTVVSNQKAPSYPGTYAGLQLRQPLSLLSQRFNITFASHTGAPYQPEAIMLSRGNSSAGLGLGKLKNLNVNAASSFSNLIARATSFGKYANRIPAQ